MESAIPYPWSGARVRVFRMSMSKVPGISSGFFAMMLDI